VKEQNDVGAASTAILSYYDSSGLITKNINDILILNKGKAIPLQAWTGSEGSRRLRLPDFKTINT